MFYNIILSSVSNGKIEKPSIEDILYLKKTNRPMKKFTTPFPYLNSYQYQIVFDTYQCEDLLSYLTFNFQHYTISKKHFSPFKPIQSIFLTVQYIISQKKGDLKICSLSDPICLLIYDLFSVSDPNDYFNLLIQFQISVLYHLLESGLNTDDLDTEDEIFSVSLHKLYCYLEEKKIIKLKNMIKVSNKKLLDEFIHINELCYLLWECIANKTDKYEIGKLSLREKFEFFYLDKLIVPSTEVITNYLSNNLSKYTCDILRIPIRNQLIELPLRRNDLIERYSNVHCKKCQEKRNDGICLLCGKVLCPGKSCCRTAGDGIGEATRHIEKYHNNVGLIYIYSKNNVF